MRCNGFENCFPEEINVVGNTASENSLSFSKFIPDVSFSLNSLNLKITVSTEDAVKRTIEWYSLLNGECSH